MDYISILHNKMHVVIYMIIIKYIMKISPYKAKNAPEKVLKKELYKQLGC